MSIVVIGSINADLALSTDRLPLPGETVRASSFVTYPGGKGANQAVAASRLGADVHLVGRVGGDAMGTSLIAALDESRVDTSGVSVDANASTGTALITVASNGENTIVTSGGANHRVGDEELETLDRLLSGASMLLVQLEIPMDVVQRAVRRAADARVPVMLDPAPIAELPASTLRDVTWITPNEHEAQALSGSAVSDDTGAARAAADLRARGVEHVVITMGTRGSLYAGPDGDLRLEAPAVAAIDTVACGDAFNGALAVALTGGREIEAALRFACAAGAAAATIAGAYPSMPTLRKVEALLGDRPAGGR